MKRYRNNEIFGMTAEKVICDLYNLDYPDYLVTRSNKQLELKLIPYLRNFLKQYNINVVEYIGYRNDPEDFILENGETLSVKTNIIGKRMYRQQLSIIQLLLLFTMIIMV